LEHQWHWKIEISTYWASINFTASMDDSLVMESKQKAGSEAVIQNPPSSPPQPKP